MLVLKIPFSGSWTNSFSNANHEPLFTSGGAFGKGMRGLNTTVLRTSEGHTSRVDNVRALMKANTTLDEAGNPVCNMTYQVPMSYDNTVRGVLARLLGCVGRLSAMPEDHPMQKVFAGMRYEMHITSEHDELMALATPPKELQGSGAGLMPKGNPLYEGGELAKKIFGFLDLSLSELIAGVEPEGTWTPGSPTALIQRLSVLKEEQAELQASVGKDECAFAERAKRIAKNLTAAGVDYSFNPDVNAWHWAGAVLVSKILLLPKEELQTLIEAGALSARGNLTGIAMSGNVGGLTIKDLYAGSGCKKAYSTRIPLVTDLWFERAGQEGKKQKISLGVIKKSGYLQIELDLPESELDTIQEAINAAAVGPLHFGKKGLAYLERMYRK